VQGGEGEGQANYEEALGKALIQGAVQMLNLYILDGLGDEAEGASAMAKSESAAAEETAVAEGGAAAEMSTGKMMGALREAAVGKGNFGVGSLTAGEADAVGEAWVGSGARTASGGIRVSADGLRQFRPATMKPNLGRVQANLEWRLQPSGAWQGNGHIDIVK
jgi:filamentous hemagglutinin